MTPEDLRAIKARLTSKEPDPEPTMIHPEMYRALKEAGYIRPDLAQTTAELPGGLRPMKGVTPSPSDHEQS